MEKQYFTYVGNGSSKFWEVSVDEKKLHVRYGKIGTGGKTQQKNFESMEAAVKEAEKLIGQKKAKGYIPGNESDEAPKPFHEFFANLDRVIRITENMLADSSRNIPVGRENLERELIQMKEVNDPEFWSVIALFNWKKEDEEDILKPAIRFLSKQSDEYIFKFDEKMTLLLYMIDGDKWADGYLKSLNTNYLSPDDFLYCRCTVVANGPVYYTGVFAGTIPFDASYSFEDLLYLPMTAWAKKHGKEMEAMVDEYPYSTTISSETGCNEKNWAHKQFF